MRLVLPLCALNARKMSGEAKVSPRARRGRRLAKRTRRIRRGASDRPLKRIWAPGVGRAGSVGRYPAGRAGANTGWLETAHAALNVPSATTRVPLSHETPAVVPARTFHPPSSSRAGNAENPNLRSPLEVNTSIGALRVRQKISTARRSRVRRGLLPPPPSESWPWLSRPATTSRANATAPCS
jgi:hypothetical protein